MDKKTVIEKLECFRLKADPQHCTEEKCPYNNADPEFGCWCLSNRLIYDALELLKEQEPRLMTLEEVKAIALRETERILSSGVEPVWLEQNDDGLTNLNLVLISWWYMDNLDEDETEFEFIAKYFGTDIDDTLNYLDYGTRWRVWSSKPTIEQRKAVKWE